MNVDFVAGAFAAWLIEQLADAGRRQLTRSLFGDSQERALVRAADKAIQLTAEDFCPEGGVRAEELAMVIDQVFGVSVPFAPSARHATLLQALQGGIRARLAPLDDVGLTGTGSSSAELLGVSAGAVSNRLIGHLVHEIISRAAHGSPLAPLADQFNHDVSHLQVLRIEAKVDWLTRTVQRALRERARLASKISVLRRAGLPDRRLFVGREQDLERLARIESRGVVTDLLVGLGGIGKTALVLEHAHRSLESTDPPDFVWWFDASTRAGLAFRMGALYRELTGAETDDMSSAERLRGWLDCYPGRWIVVFDNVDDRQTLTQLMPQAGSGQVLVTSRNQFWDDIEVLHINEMSPNDAVALLERKSGLGDPDGAARLTDDLGNLALSLVQAASYLARKARSEPGWTYDRYRRLLRTVPQVVHGRDAAHLNQTMVKAVQTSLEAVGQDARDIMGAIAYLAPDGIPSGLFATSPARSDNKTANSVIHLSHNLLPADPVLKPVPRNERLLETFGNELRMSDALEELVGYSLLTLDKAAGSATYGVHRVVQAVVRGGHGSEPEHAYAAIRLVASTHPRDNDGRPFPSPAWVLHVRALDAGLRHLVRRDGRMNQQVTFELAGMMHAAARALRDEICDYQAAAGVAARAARLFRLSLGSLNITYAKALNYLAVILSDLALPWIALLFDQEAVRIERVLPASDLDLGWAVHDLGIDFRDLADRAEGFNADNLRQQARRHLDEAIALARQVPNVTARAPDLAWFLQDSALLHNREGDTSRALSEFDEALELVDQHLPERDPRRGRPRVNLSAYLCPPPSAGMIGSEQNTIRAEQLAREALTLWEQVYGSNHMFVARALLRVAECMLVQANPGHARIREALDYLERASEISRKRLPAHHPMRQEIEEILLDPAISRTRRLNLDSSMD